MQGVVGADAFLKIIGSQSKEMMCCAENTVLEGCREGASYQYDFRHHQVCADGQL